jgi:hypothetical protein
MIATGAKKVAVTVRVKVVVKVIGVKVAVSTLTTKVVFSDRVSKMGTMVFNDMFMIDRKMGLILNKLLTRVRFIGYQLRCIFYVAELKFVKGICRDSLWKVCRIFLTELLQRLLWKVCTIFPGIAAGILSEVSAGNLYRMALHTNFLQGIMQSSA